MKKLLFGAALVGFTAFASAQTITFEETTVDYGTVKPGADGNRVFKIKNTGDKPLILSNVKPGCGCTVPTYDKTPIAPGGTGEIKVAYNTKNAGTFRKQIEVFSNDPQNSRSVIWITGKVDPNAPEKVLTPAEKKKQELDSKRAELDKAQKGLETAKTAVEKNKEEIKTLKQSIKTLNKEVKTLSKELASLA